MTKTKKVIVILGQTATGKSNLAVRLAKKYKGEVISADSRQVYKGLDIGTGKIAKKDMRGVPHFMLDVTSPKKKFTVAEYKILAEKKIEEIISRGHIPIICGGTGFYIDSVVNGTIFPEVPPNLKLRRELAMKTSVQLFKMLSKLDKARAKDIKQKNELNNKVRLIRAIEIARALGKVPKILNRKSKYEFIQIGLHLPAPELKKNVSKRVKKMFADGLLKEITKLKRSGVSSKRLRELGFEYFEPTPEKVISETIKYSKRQMTWFKRPARNASSSIADAGGDSKIKWFSPKETAKIEKYLKSKMLGR